MSLLIYLYVNDVKMLVGVYTRNPITLVALVMSLLSLSRNTKHGVKIFPANFARPIEIQTEAGQSLPEYFFQINDCHDFDGEYV